MSKKVLKTSEVVNAYKVLNEAKLNKLKDNEKIQVWKLFRQLKPIAIRCNEELSDAQKRFMPDSEFPIRLQKAQQYEIQKRQGEETSINDEEYLQILNEFHTYKQLVEKASRELLDCEVEVDLELMDDDSFDRLLSSNDWNIEQIEQCSILLKD